MSQQTFQHLLHIIIKVCYCMQPLFVLFRALSESCTCTTNSHYLKSRLPKSFIFWQIHTVIFNHGDVLQPLTTYHIITFYPLIRITKASLGSSGTQKLPFFLACLAIRMSSLSLALYSLIYFSALRKMIFLFSFCF